MIRNFCFSLHVISNERLTSKSIIGGCFCLVYNKNCYQKLYLFGINNIITEKIGYFKLIKRVLHKWFYSYCRSVELTVVVSTDQWYQFIRLPNKHNLLQYSKPCGKFSKFVVVVSFLLVVLIFCGNVIKPLRLSTGIFLCQGLFQVHHNISVTCVWFLLL